MPLGAGQPGRHRQIRRLCVATSGTGLRWKPVHFGGRGTQPALGNRNGASRRSPGPGLADPAADPLVPGWLSGTVAGLQRCSRSAVPASAAAAMAAADAMSQPGVREPAWRAAAGCAVGGRWACCVACARSRWNAELGERRQFEQTEQALSCRRPAVCQRRPRGRPAGVLQVPGHRGGARVPDRRRAAARRGRDQCHPDRSGGLCGHACLQHVGGDQFPAHDRYHRARPCQGPALWQENGAPPRPGALASRRDLG
jgi:hypothetical protein